MPIPTPKHAARILRVCGFSPPEEEGASYDVVVPHPDPDYGRGSGTSPPLRDADMASVTSLGNSIQFNTNDDDSYHSQDSNDSRSSSSGMEVMDLRPRVHGSNSSIVSIGSNITIDTGVASDLFQTANYATATTTAGGDHGNLHAGVGAGEVGDALTGDLPNHWTAAQEGSTTAVGVSSNHWADVSEGYTAITAAETLMDNPLGESEQAYRALIRLMGGRDVGYDEEEFNGQAAGNNNNNSGGGRNDLDRGPMMRRPSVSSFASAETGQSGFW